MLEGGQLVRDVIEGGPGTAVGCRRVLVVADSQIIREGVGAMFERAGTVHATVGTATLPEVVGVGWDLVVVWIDDRDGLDHFATVQRIATCETLRAGGARVVALHARELSMLVQLRLAEVGVRRAVTLSGFERHGVFAALDDAAEGLRVPDAAHLRAALGLAPHGRIDVLLDAAGALPAQVWSHGLPQDRLPVTRAQITHLRRVALVDAGLTAPSYAKYASSVRRAPDLPLWSDVRGVVRQAWGHAA